MNLRQSCPTRQGVCRHPTQARLSYPARHAAVVSTPSELRRGVHPSGDGVLDTIGSITKGLQGLRLASDVLFGPIGSTVSNVLSNVFNRNPEARPISPGEKHIVLPTKHGLTRANFAGPGTQVEKRVRRGDRGVDGPRGIDEIARRHDIDYVNARTPADIRRADNRMIRAIDSSTAGRRTKQVVKRALQAKTFGEDLGVFGPNTFTEVIEDDNAATTNSGSASGYAGATGLPTDHLMRRVHQQLRKRPRHAATPSSSSSRARKRRRRRGAPATGQGVLGDLLRSVGKTVAPIVLKRVTEAVLPLLADRIASRFRRHKRPRHR